MRNVHSVTSIWRENDTKEMAETMVLKWLYRLVVHISIGHFVKFNYICEQNITTSNVSTWHYKFTFYSFFFQHPRKEINKIYADHSKDTANLRSSPGFPRFRRTLSLDKWRSVAVVTPQTNNCLEYVHGVTMINTYRAQLVKVEPPQDR